jgi:hypothetical protein
MRVADEVWLQGRHLRLLGQLVLVIALRLRRALRAAAGDNRFRRNLNAPKFLSTANFVFWLADTRPI